MNLGVGRDGTNEFRSGRALRNMTWGRGGEGGKKKELAEVIKPPWTCITVNRSPFAEGGGGGRRVVGDGGWQRRLPLWSLGILKILKSCHP
jgi:hypothetical protein